MNKVMLFAHLKETAGNSTLQVDATGKTVAEIRNLLSPKLGDLEGVMVAVNEEFATEDYMIAADDVIALIPPVSGG
nr:molybdopterin converting factor subunit 1 [Paenibacillus bovis]